MNDKSTKASRPDYIAIDDDSDSTPTGSVNGSGEAFGYIPVVDDSPNESGLMFIRDGEVGDGRQLDDSIEQSIECTMKQSIESAIEQHINENGDGNVDQRHVTSNQINNRLPVITGTGATQASIGLLGASATGAECIDNTAGQSASTSGERINRRTRTFSDIVCSSCHSASCDCFGQGQGHYNVDTDTSTGVPTVTTVSGRVNRKERTFSNQIGFNSDSENDVIASTSTRPKGGRRRMKTFAEPERYGSVNESGSIESKLIEPDDTGSCCKSPCCKSPCCASCTVL